MVCNKLQIILLLAMQRTPVKCDATNHFDHAISLDIHLARFLTVRCSRHVVMTVRNSKLKNKTFGDPFVNITCHYYNYF